MKKCYISLSFLCDEVQRSAILLFASTHSFNSIEDAVENFNLACFSAFKKEEKNKAFSNWLHDLSSVEKEKVRKNYSEYKKNFSDFKLDEEAFKNWLVSLSESSISGMDGISDIDGWEVVSGFSGYLQNQDNYLFFEIDVSAEETIIKATRHLF